MLDQEGRSDCLKARMTDSTAAHSTQRVPQLPATQKATLEYWPVVDFAAVEEEK